MKICKQCKKEFRTNYTSTKGVKYQVHSVVFCSKGCATASRYRCYEDLIFDIHSFIKSTGRYCTLSEVTTNCNVSSKTLVKKNIKIKDINEKLGFKNRKNYFEDKIYELLVELLPNIKIDRQVQLPDLINDKTGYMLYLDFYIPEKRICIEADGSQHYDKTSAYYSEEGVYRDSLKNTYFKNNIIRIKYKSNLTKEYVKTCLIGNPELSLLLLELESATTIPNGSTSQANGDGSGLLLEKEDDIVSSV